jgi:O-acetyl-ADP-ribose deacetylase (regulator of RNase III)
VTSMRLHLVDLDASIVAAWRLAFDAFSEVDVQQADLLTVANNTVVSPANSYGVMDGGIDAAYVGFFGKGIELAVQEAIGLRQEGYLPVGASLVVRTKHRQIPYLIVAPTMLMPEPVPKQNCYRAMLAVLRICGGDEAIGREVFCPGLGTGVGAVPPMDAAEEMARAYADWKKDAG